MYSNAWSKPNCPYVDTKSHADKCCRVEPNLDHFPYQHIVPLCLVRLFVMTCRDCVGDSGLGKAESKRCFF